MDREKIKQAIEDLDNAGEGAEVQYYDGQNHVTMFRTSGLLVAVVVDREGYMDLAACQQVAKIARSMNLAYREPDRTEPIPGKTDL